MNRMPTFLIIGAHKAGTTSLYHYLNQHPQIFMSPVKETHFFSFLGHSLDFADPGFEPNKLMAATTIEAYRALFAQAGEAVAIGEASPSYLYVRETAVNIHHHLPQVKLIAILRHPADRAYSNYLHCRARTPQEPLANFAAALQAEPARIDQKWSPLWHYQQKGFYFQQLQPYFQLFSREQIGIFLYDDLVTNPQTMLQQIYQFLQVDPTFVPDFSKKHNVSGIPKNRLWRFAAQNSRWSRRLFPETIRQRIKKTALTRPPFPLEIRQQLVALYRDDILQLQTLIQRDLSHWLF